MIFNKHSNLDGLHAFLSPSQPYWLNYVDEKLISSYENRVIAVKNGTEMHELACRCIQKHREVVGEDTFAIYVNDAIKYEMTPEQKLVYSENCFGTADAISFRNNFLRIHDLKTGVHPAKMTQLMVYAALFCLEYRVQPTTIDIELRIYQNDSIIYHTPDADEITHIMDRIIASDKIINKIKLEEGV